MVLEGGLGGTRRERAAGDKVFDELVVLGKRRGDVERDGVLCDEGDVRGFNAGRGHWSEEWMVTFR